MEGTFFSLEIQGPSTRRDTAHRASPAAQGIPASYRTSDTSSSTTCSPARRDGCGALAERATRNTCGTRARIRLPIRISRRESPCPRRTRRFSDATSPSRPDTAVRLTSSRYSSRTWARRGRTDPRLAITRGTRT